MNKPLRGIKHVHCRINDVFLTLIASDLTFCLTNICDSISKMTQTVFTSTSTTHNLTHFIAVLIDLSVQSISSIIIMLFLQLLKTGNSTVTSVISNLRFHSLRAL